MASRSKKEEKLPKRPKGLEGRRLDDALRRVQAPTVQGKRTEAKQWNRYTP
jgi:hypothetical protein